MHLVVWLDKVGTSRQSAGARDMHDDSARETGVTDARGSACGKTARLSSICLIGAARIVQWTCPNSTAVAIDNFPAGTAFAAHGLVTETYPPEVNGVALTFAQVVEGLQRRNHDVQLIRPRQQWRRRRRAASARFQEVLMRGMPIPRYPNLRMGVPAKRRAGAAVVASTGPTSCTSPPKGRWAGRRCRPRCS